MDDWLAVSEGAKVESWIEERMTNTQLSGEKKEQSKAVGGQRDYIELLDRFQHSTKSRVKRASDLGAHKLVSPTPYTRSQ